MSNASVLKNHSTMASKIGSKADKNGKIYKMMASGEVNIISYGALGSTPAGQ